MSPSDPNQGLPPFAIEYVAIVPVSHRVVRWFHAWLKRTGASILQLQASEIERFVGLLLVPQKPRMRNTVRRRLFRYFDWLRSRQLLTFDPRCLWPRSDFALPSEAQGFVKSLEPTHKRSTLNAHRTALRQFHIWLASQSVPLEAVDRAHVASWLQWIHARGLHASTRVHLIATVRAYFFWLAEQPGFAGPSPDALFRSSDLPKLPQYLPRPVPADVDRILQRRLRTSRTLPELGLLLMRRTGLRIGELRTLAYHCVRADHRGQSFLKVPLGKLDNERLVPLDRATLRLILKLRVLGSTGRRGRRRTLLLETSTGKPIAYEKFRAALARACRGLSFAEPMTSHRLRHTFATSMLAGGMSLPAIMKLLGHRDYRMTLRYAAVTTETLADEYAAALDTIDKRYQLGRDGRDALPSASSILDLARNLIAKVDDAGLDKHRARVLVRRLQRLNAAVQRLLAECARRGARSD